MPRLKLSYFDFHGGRGEVARIALSIGGIDFEDHRIPVADWPAIRDQMRFRALPVLEVDGEVITQSNAINRYVGRLAGLYPDDDLEAAREALVAGPIRLYLERLQEILDARGGQYFADGKLTVADLKVFVWIRSLRAGILDHVPTDLPDRVAPGLIDHCGRVAKHPGVSAYYAAR